MKKSSALLPEETKSSVSLCLDVKQYFHQSLQEALHSRKMETYPIVESYLVGILEHYALTTNLYPSQDREMGKKSQETLAEMLLRATQAPPKIRFDLLKRLGDSALYISGFFGDSLQRKVVDVDYYINMGSTAYISLSYEIEEDTFAKLYREIAQRFNEFVDVFTWMSQKTMPKDEKNIFRMIEVYARTGSPLLYEELAEQGVILPSEEQLKCCKNQ